MFGRKRSDSSGDSSKTYQPPVKFSVPSWTRIKRESNKPYKIMIVDDDPEIVEVLTSHLEKEGFEVEGCTQNLRAYDLAEVGQPDLIILDINMPHLDGWDILKIFSLHEGLKNIPVVMMTADRNAFKKVENIENYGVTGHMFKPLIFPDLSDLINSSLENRRKNDDIPSSG